MLLVLCECAKSNQFNALSKSTKEHAFVTSFQAVFAWVLPQEGNWLSCWLDWLMNSTLPNTTHTTE